MGVLSRAFYERALRAAWESADPLERMELRRLMFLDDDEEDNGPGYPPLPTDVPPENIADLTDMHSAH